MSNTPLALSPKLHRLYRNGLSFSLVGGIGGLALLVLLSVTVSEAEEDPRLIIDPGGPSGTVNELLFTPDGTTLISLGNDKAIRFWDLAGGELIKTLRLQIGDGSEGKLYTGAISPDGRWLAVGGYPFGSGKEGHPFYLIDLETGEVAAMLRGHTNVVKALAFSGDGHWLVSGGGDYSVRVWDLGSEVMRDKRKGEAMVITASQVLEAHKADVYAVDFSQEVARKGCLPSRNW